MHIDVNGRRVREAWDAAETAGELGMTAGFMAEDVTPDRDDKIQIDFHAAGENDAIV